MTLPIAEGDRIQVKRGSRWLDCTVESGPDGNGWITVRRCDNGRRMISGTDGDLVRVPRAGHSFNVRPRERECPPGCEQCDHAVPRSRGRLIPALDDGAIRTAPKADRLAVARALVPHPKPRPAKRSKDYLAWVRTLPCICGCGESPIEAHHFGPRGMSKKADDRRAVPLSVRCHRGFHNTGSLPCFREARVDDPRVHTEKTFYEAQARMLIAWDDMRETKGGR